MWGRRRARHRADLTAIVPSFRRAGSEGPTASADVLGWDFAFERNETAAGRGP